MSISLCRQLVVPPFALLPYATACARHPQVVTHRLPRLNQEEAGAVVFLGHDPKGTKCDDIAANPEVRLPGHHCTVTHIFRRYCLFCFVLEDTAVVHHPNFQPLAVTNTLSHFLGVTVAFVPNTRQAGPRLHHSVLRARPGRPGLRRACRAADAVDPGLGAGVAGIHLYADGDPGGDVLGAFRGMPQVRKTQNQRSLVQADSDLAPSRASSDPICT